MKLFVTGGTGFIGSHLLERALAQGDEIVALRRTPASRPHRALPGAPRWIDLPMEAVPAAELAGCDALIHLAAHTPNVPYDSLENCLQGNVIAPLHLFRAAAEAGVRRIVVAGSCFEYGLAGERYEFIPTDAPLEPTQTYPASKAAASVAFYQLAIELGLELSIHRIFQVFGEGEAPGRLWPSIRRAALAGEDLEMTPAEQVRDFVPVEETAAKLLAAAGEAVTAGKPVIQNLGTGRPQTLREFAEYWWGHWNASGRLIFGAKPYRAGEVMRFVPRL